MKKKIKMSVATLNVKIEGMSCGSCSYKIECEVGDLPGVKDAKVDLAAKTATFSYDTSSSTGPDQILATIHGLDNGKFKATKVIF